VGAKRAGSSETSGEEWEPEEWWSSVPGGVMGIELLVIELNSHS